MAKKKTYVFHGMKRKKPLKIIPTVVDVFQGEKDRKGESMYLFYIRDYAKQKLAAPYVQIFSKGDEMYSETWYREEEANAIFNFFTKAHMISPPSILKR